jgi:hypothetical protein
MKSQEYGITGIHRHYCFFTEVHLKNLFIRAGLKITKITFIDFGTMLPDLISRFLRVFPFLKNISFPLILVEARPCEHAQNSTEAGEKQVQSRHSFIKVYRLLVLS